MIRRAQLVAICATVVFFGYVIHARLAVLDDVRRESDKVAAETAKEEEYRDDLEKDAKRMSGDDFFVKAAREKLGLVFDSDIVYVRSKEK